MKKLILFTLSFAFLGTLPQAQGAMPVVDTSAINQAILQFQQLKRQYDMMKQQHDELVALKDNLTGSYGMGALLNGLEDQSSRRPLPQSWQEVVQMQAQGFYGDRLKHYSEMFPTINVNLLSSNLKDRDVIGYKLAKKNTQSAFAATEAIYNQLDKRLKTIEGLVEQIDQTGNVKETMDLNSRIVAETGFISLDLARLNSMQLNLQATLQNEANRELENHSEFFSKPN